MTKFYQYVDRVDKDTIYVNLINDWKSSTEVKVPVFRYNTTILFIDNSPQGVFQLQFTILEEIKSTYLKSLFTIIIVLYKSNHSNSNVGFW